MYIRRASSPSTVLWAFHPIQPSSYILFLRWWHRLHLLGTAHSLFYHLYADDTDLWPLFHLRYPGSHKSFSFLYQWSCWVLLRSSVAAQPVQNGVYLHGLAHDAIWTKYPTNVFHSPWDRLSSHAPPLYVTLAFYWTVNYPWKHHISVGGGD